MPHDEASAVIGPPSHLRLVPDPTPESRCAHLRVLIHNATDRHGKDSRAVADLKEKLVAAMRLVRKKKKPG